ncbi:Peptidase A1 [Macleaya cordata]|uniref:Peptidase A1 n=1 Tax=Macleaya cordata TaxID=56857 RepID=A0A200Q4U7_MACCD|nr:Peptidase A1 [Macleaya cordata]
MASSSSSSSSSSLHLFLLVSIFFSLLILSHSKAQRSTNFKPNALILPIHRDAATNLYVTEIHKRTPLTPVPFVIDLNGRFLWVNCDHQYLSSTYHAPRCHSSQCSIANTHWCRTCSGSPSRPGCHNNTCGLVSFNPITRRSGPGELAEDVLSIQSTDGSNPGPLVTIPRFLFACAPSFLVQGGTLPTGVQGMAGLGRTQIALPNQLASHFGFQHKFAMCLGGSGVVFFGGGPYMMNPGIDISQSISYTPLIISQQGEYYIGVRSIKINNKPVPLNTSLLSIDRHGLGGTKISSVVPYTVLETSIYKAVTQFFANELSAVPKVDPIAPFGLCFNSTNVGSTRVGPGVPNIDLVLHTDRVVWRIFGANSMAQVRDNVMCLAVVDGGVRNTKASIVIGAHQLEDNLLQFDLTTSRLGFSSSLLFRRTTCGNFNSTSSA